MIRQDKKIKFMEIKKYVIIEMRNFMVKLNSSQIQFKDL